MFKMTSWPRARENNALWIQSLAIVIRSGILWFLMCTTKIIISWDSLVVLCQGWGRGYKVASWPVIQPEWVAIRDELEPNQICSLKAFQWQWDQAVFIYMPHSKAEIVFFWSKTYNMKAWYITDLWADSKICKILSHLNG